MFRSVLLAILLAAPLHAEVTRIEVTSRADLLSGKSFAAAGPYEKLSGKIYFAVDPRNSANRMIADIDKTPKNASGKVEFSSDFYMIKPKDVKRGNGTRGQWPWKLQSSFCSALTRGRSICESFLSGRQFSVH